MIKDSDAIDPLGQDAIYQKINTARYMVGNKVITIEEYNQRIEGYIATLREFLQV